MRLARAAAARIGACPAIFLLACLTLAHPRAQTAAAYAVRSLDDASDIREARPDVLDTLILPGSVMKVVTLAAALESQVIEPDTARICRRVVTVDGRRYTCTHPDLKRPLSPAEALAYSCNDFFVSLAPRLPRAVFNDVRTRAGLGPVSAAANLAASLVGLDGPPASPRTLLDAVVRLVRAGSARSVSLQESTRRVLVEGLKGAAEYGSAGVFGERSLSVLAKTGTAPMPSGGWMGVVVGLTPADKPSRGFVVVAPGAAGLDAAAIAADLLVDARSEGPPLQRSPRSGGSSDPPAQARSFGVDRSLQAGGSKDPPLLAIRVGITAPNGKITVARLPLEDYVARVLAGEGQPTARDAAQEALAITARTFALANLNRHRREGYDLCDTTHCQVIRPSTDVTRRAAESTAGRVLVHQGQPATVFYSALCGGRSELASDVWPGAVDYLTTPQDDEACRDEAAWDNEIPVDQLERALRQAGHRGRLRDLRVTQRNQSGRVARIRVEGFSPNELSGHDFRMAVGRVIGWQQVKSTAFDVVRTSAGYRFRGRGFGHGVGLCVIGAGHRAAAGSGVDEILRFYFPSLRVESYQTLPALTAGAPVREAGPRAAAAATDVLMAVPAGEESERSTLVTLVRASRDRIAAAAAVKAPPSIRVTVHPTVEAFGRATGQPWWVSGATEGSNIDLLPLTILRQRGQLERTVRHEVAHVLLDAALSGRSLWVREGAAFYFADPDAAPARPASTTCPRDEEFLRPISAGAHRAAYARAEACFRRAMSQGKRWQDVR